MPSITLLYAGLLGLVAVGLMMAVGRARAATGINTGDGGNDDLIIPMRSQANFVEFVPLALILIGMLEMNGVSATAIHALCAVLLVARLCHAFGFTAAHPTHVLRSVGAVGSMLSLVVASIWAVVAAL